MGKKKRKSFSSTSNSFTHTNSISLEEEIMQHLILFKEVGGLVIGFNAVLRGLKQKIFSVVMINSRKSTSAMYHALNMLCKGTDVMFLQIQDISYVTLSSKLPSSTAYGIKASVATEREELLKLLEKINHARNSKKSQKQSKTESSDMSQKIDSDGDRRSIHFDESHCQNSENNDCSTEEPSQSLRTECDTIGINRILHPAHERLKGKVSELEDFLTLVNPDSDFPNYRNMSDKIRFCIK